MAIVNHFDRTVDALTSITRFPRLKAFLSSHLWPWISSYLKYAFQRRFPFPTYANRAKTGIYRIAPSTGADAIRIAITGDWANGTDEAYIIGGLIEEGKTDFTN